MPHIRITDVSKTYPPQRRGGQPVTAVDAVSLDIEKGDVFGVIGYSGAGKSTLVRLINGLEPVSAGSIEVDGVDIATLREAQLRRVRQGIGMIFQRFNLLRSRTISGNIAYPLEVARVPRAQRAARVAELLDFVGLADKADAYPEQLSGGQQQRVGIARALAAEPGILLADEATSALDPETTDEVLDLLARVNRELGVTIVVITHEMDVIARIANKVAVMEAGRVVEQGATYDVFTAPQTDTARRFVRTVVRALPDGDALTALRAQHEGRLFTISFTDEGASEARVFGALARAGVDFNLVHGGVDDIQGRVYGLLTIAVRGDDAAVRDALASIGGGVTISEVAA
ncbi:methionine ABC transporter ATP-binding protein [Microbacterium paludicola]|uniref:ATP-binding cassette domain-containing protein n=1 Tax=Microbacterium paludicola TaxID=300019 RepID=A0A4Y9FVM9_9MICO|nr:ATP-binding cassette domain-containing protein [Microbacterium paludicola]MBF0816735.1 ATP-binding cassette domain-containing protein [Microbacterium paludicola]TFU32611.1 ATP-binding cassette domain-containing protein [Microbacterium paludicola]